jgi:hypothetical protein
VALDLNYIDQYEFNETYKMLDEVSKMMLSLAQYLRKKAE